MSQYIRKCSLLLASENGKGIDLSEFHIRFNIKKADVSTPNSAEIVVYNLSNETISILQKEFDSVLLQAGYNDNFGIIFKGYIYQYIKSREGGKDTVLKIMASDGDRGFNFATVNKTLNKGSSNDDILNTLLESIGNKNVDKGFIDEIPKKENIRGKAMYGMTRNYLNDFTISTNTGWSIQDGSLNIIKNDGYLPNEAVELSSNTGLIGRASQTLEGIKVKCLLNPKLKVGNRLKIQEESIDLFKGSSNYSDSYKTEIATKINNDGLYRILGIDYEGDTMGNEWYSNIVCVGIDDSAPINSKLIDLGI